MKVEDVISRVRNIAGDVQALQYTNGQIVDWINDGIRECAVQNNLLQKSITTPSVPGQASYDLPTDILKLHSVLFANQKLRVLTMEEFETRYLDNEPDQTGLSTVCYIWANKLTLFPTPDRIGNVVVRYLYHPVAHTSNALSVEISLPVGYHSRIVDYCLAQVYQQDDNVQQYAVKMQEFKTGVQDLKDQPENTYDAYPSISVSPRDMGDGYYE